MSLKSPAMFKIVKFLFFSLIIIGCSAGLFYYYQITTPAGLSEQAVEFSISQGEGVKSIARALKDKNLISSQFYFEVYVWSKKLERNFIAGSYSLSARLNIKAIVAKLTKPGESEQTITIIEGWNNREIAKYLANQNLGSAENFLQLVSHDLNKFVVKYDFLQDKPEGADLEGYLFPDTYRIFKNAAVEEIVFKLLDNFDKKLTSQWREDIKKNQRSIFEVITLASIIEKEVREPNDMAQVADIFYKRLRAGIALQSDATVNYITGKGLTQPTAADLLIDHPYNTYKYKGLTPTPIANPGLAAIYAAIYPSLNPYYYFLTTTEGKVIYSKTYQEHLQNKRKYLD